MARISKREAGFTVANAFLSPVASMAQGTLESEMFIHISLLHKNPSGHLVLFAIVSPKPQQVLSNYLFTDCHLLVMTLGKLLYLSDSQFPHL